MAQESYRSSPEVYNEPGSLMEDQNEKLALRHLNGRLEQYVRNQRGKEGKISTLKTMLAKQEVEFRQKLKLKETTWERTLQNLRSDAERKQLQINELQEELEAMTASKQDMEERLRTSESQLTEARTRCNHMSAELASAKHNLEKMVNEFSQIKYQNDNHENERISLANQVTLLKEKNHNLNTELTKVAGDLKIQNETFSRMLLEKGEEIESLSDKNRSLLAEKETLQQKLKSEFDTKLAEFVKNREEQYKCEKDEWVRIFKEEFNRKIKSFKEANNELKHKNSQLEEEMSDHRNRTALLKRQKAELEASSRTLEDELEKSRKDLDDLRKAKDMELRNKSAVIKDMRDRMKRKQVEFDELQCSKGQLQMEIAMFRQILQDAEKTAGYEPSPGPLRKKRRLDTGEDPCYGTPGLSRAVKFAQEVTSRWTPLLSRDREERKEESAYNSREGSVDDDVDLLGDSVTPGGSASIQFSSMDLSQSMLEIQNVSHHGVSLGGYTISNNDKSSVFSLPENRVLAPSEKVRIIIGSYGKAAPGEIFWDQDVWHGDERDSARLFEPSGEEIGRIEIHPDMVPDKARSRCLVM